MPQWIEIWIAGTALGMLGSLHCIGMCGPLAMAIPNQKYQGWQEIWAVFLYHFSRIFTYAIIGFAFGYVGKTFVYFAQMQWLSIICGVLLLLFTISHYTSFLRLPAWLPLQKFTQNKMHFFLQKKINFATLIALGLLNGLLPCGLVYVALTMALSYGQALESGIFMMAFGLGTIPLMASIMLLKKIIGTSIRHKINKAMPYLITLMAVLLILRGCNLGIPYLSPKVDVNVMPTACH